MPIFFRKFFSNRLIINSIDFTIPGKDYDEFERARKIAVSFRADVFRDGAVFVTVLPDDYLEKSKSIQLAQK